MRKLRSVITMLFIAAVAVCGVYMVKEVITGKSKAPVINCEKDSIKVSVKDKESALLKGMTAEDKEDGDLTQDIRVVSMSHFIKGNTRKVKYVVFDSSNQAGIYERNVTYTDYSSPRIHMKQPLRCEGTELLKIDWRQYVTAKDCIDGDLTNQIRCMYDSYMYADRTETQPITFQVSNKAGDVCVVEADLTLVNKSDPDERMKYYPVLSEYIVYTKAGKKLNLRKYVKGLEQNGIEYLYRDDRELEDRTKNQIKFSEDINYSKPGTYKVDVSYRSEGGVKAVTKMYVVVEEK